MLCVYLSDFVNPHNQAQCNNVTMCNLSTNVLFCIIQMVGEEFSVVQEVEEEHGLLDSYIEENDTGVVLKQEVSTVEGATYTLQVN